MYGESIYSNLSFIDKDKKEYHTEVINKNVIPEVTPVETRSQSVVYFPSLGEIPQFNENTDSTSSSIFRSTDGSYLGTAGTDEIVSPVIFSFENPATESPPEGNLLISGGYIASEDKDLNFSLLGQYNIIKTADGKYKLKLLKSSPTDAEYSSTKSVGRLHIKIGDSKYKVVNRAKTFLTLISIAIIDDKIRTLTSSRMLTSKDSDPLFDILPNSSLSGYFSFDHSNSSSKISYECYLRINQKFENDNAISGKIAGVSFSGHTKESQLIFRKSSNCDISDDMAPQELFFDIQSYIQGNQANIRASYNRSSFGDSFKPDLSNENWQINTECFTSSFSIPPQDFYTNNKGKSEFQTSVLFSGAQNGSSSVLGKPLSYYDPDLNTTIWLDRLLTITFNINSL